jgi:CDP-4-dehydro-6-deoxyglucose reductase
VFAELEERSLLRIEGPLGQFGYTHDAKTPALLIGGGTGFAPLKAIIRHVLEKSLARDLHLFWGVRTRVDLYEHERVLEWTRTYPNLRYTPVLSDVAGGDPWPGRRGMVHEVVFEEYPDLASHEIYVSGPPALVEAVKSGALRRGLTPEYLHFDSFEYAPDALAKMRALDRK